MFLFRSAKKKEKKVPVVRYGKDGSVEVLNAPNAKSSHPAKTSNLLAPVLGGGRKASAEPKEWYDNGIDPAQHVDDLSTVTKSIRMNLNVNKLRGESDNDEWDDDNASNSSPASLKTGNALGNANKQATPNSKTLASSISVRSGDTTTTINLQAPRPLREQIRMFYEKHDKTKIANGLDNFVAFVAKNGVEAFNDQLKKRYGETLDEMLAKVDNNGRVNYDSAPVAAAAADNNNNTNDDAPVKFSESNNGGGGSSKSLANNYNNLGNEDTRYESVIYTPSFSQDDGAGRGSFITVPMRGTLSQKITEPSQAEMNSEQFLSMKNRLREYYMSHDPSKIQSEKDLDIITQKALRIDPDELDARLKKKYFLGLTEYENLKRERQAPRVLSASEMPCGNYEFDPNGSFGVCKCGFSRADHRHLQTKQQQQRQQPGSKGGDLNLDPKKTPSISAKKPAADLERVMTRAESASFHQRPNLVIPPVHEDSEREDSIEALFSPIDRKVETTKIASPSLAAAQGRKQPPPQNNNHHNVNGSSGSGACKNYRLDMTGTTMGVCVCGYGRAEHFADSKPKLTSKTLERKWSNKNKF